MSEWEEFAAYRNMIRKAKAEAWEEGLEAKFKLLEGQDSVSLTNPYLQGEKQ